MQLKMGGKFHLRLNIGGRPIANKYREGKMKRTLKRELKVLEIVKREAIGTSIAAGDHQYRLRCRELVGLHWLPVSISSVRGQSWGRSRAGRLAPGQVHGSD